MARKNKTIFEETDVLRMFPTFVWKAKLKPKIHQNINKNIIHKLEQIRLSEPNPAPGQSWQSDHDLHKLNEFCELVDCLNDAVVSVLAFLKIGQMEFEITGV